MNENTLNHDGLWSPDNLSYEISFAEPGQSSSLNFSNSVGNPFESYSYSLSIGAQPAALTITDEGREVIRIKQDGTVSINDTLTLDEASEMFWTNVSDIGLGFAEKLTKAEEATEMWKAAALELSSQLADAKQVIMLLEGVIEQQEQALTGTTVTVREEDPVAAYERAMKVVG